jgi:hypothetical protein
MRALLASWALIALTVGRAAFAQPNPAPSPTTAASPQAYRQAYEASFRAAFRKNFIESCAAKAVGSDYDITPTCTCVADTLLQTKTVDEIQALSKDDDNPGLTEIETQCLRSAPPLTKAKS